MFRTLSDVFKTLLIILFFFLLFALTYFVALHHFKFLREQQYRAEDRAVTALETSPAQKLKMGLGLSIFQFELSEGQKYNVYSLQVNYAGYNPENLLFYVEFTCLGGNQEPVWLWQEAFQGMSYTTTVKCPDWSGTGCYYITISPIILKRVHYIAGGQKAVAKSSFTEYRVILHFTVKYRLVSPSSS